MLSIEQMSTPGPEKLKYVEGDFKIQSNMTYTPFTGGTREVKLPGTT